MKGAWLTACALVSMGARADGDIHWYAQIDNDVAFQTDRWYTSGVRIARAHKFGEGKYAEFGTAFPDSAKMQALSRGGTLTTVFFAHGRFGQLSG